MKGEITTIPNTNSDLYLVIPLIYENSNKKHFMLSPIIAFAVEAGFINEENGASFAVTKQVVTIDDEFDHGDHAIYDMKTKMWSFAAGEHGYDLDKFGLNDWPERGVAKQ